MSDIAIQVENISKLYQLGEISTGTVSRDLHRWWAKMRGKEDPFQKIGQVNDRTTSSDSDQVWALKDISFEVKKGEVLGIIGRNGAGKSTLLKILSRVTKPTTGSIRVRGRIASLLEVGTGFHPELTGRENIFLNGAIMGMTKFEIKSKLDEIIAFSGVERYIDTPVKRYSSGMYVRLAFAVAAHLDPEILIIDEVLAVGDAEFQKKCLGKMKDVSEQEGRTVLFVSHNLEAVQKLCDNGLLIENGKIASNSKVDTSISQYLNGLLKKNDRFIFSNRNDNIKYLGFVTQVTIEDDNGNSQSTVSCFSPWAIRILFTLTNDITSFIVAIGIVDQFGATINTTWSIPSDLRKGSYEACFKNTFLLLTPGIYYINMGLSSHLTTFFQNNNQVFINITDDEQPYASQIVNTKSGIVMNQLKVKIQQIVS